MSRRGKIARLPRSVRDELNRRMEDGEEGAGLLEWLNSRPAVKKVLKEKFDGRPVSEQNLSAWRQGGYQDWLARQEIVAQVEELAADAADLEGSTRNKVLTDHLAKLMAVRYAEALTNPNNEPEEQWEQKLQKLRSLCREVIELRKSDLNAERLEMERERWAFERKELNEKEQAGERSKAKAAKLAPYRAQMKQMILAKLHGEKGAAEMAEIMYDLEPGWVYYKGMEEDDPALKAAIEKAKAKAAKNEAKAGGAKAGQTEGESSLIKADKGERGECEDGGWRSSRWRRSQW